MSISRRCLVLLSLASLVVASQSSAAYAQRVRKTKTGIIATIGPQSSRTATIRRMFKKGAGVARINLSHNNAKTLAKLVPPIRRAARSAGKKVPLLADLPGGKVRIGIMGSAPATLRKGQAFELIIGGKQKTTEHLASVGYSRLAEFALPGDHLLLDDGNIVLEVEKVEKGKIATRVIKGAKLRSRMGLAIQDKELPFPAMTSQDRRKLKLAVAHGVDWIGVSMVQSPRNLKATRRALDKLGATHVKIVAKIESISAMANLEAIVDHADIIMIARGDLGTAVGPANLAKAQARIAKVTRARGKQFIAATNFMSNMIEHRNASAANEADVKTALKQGPGWFMLNETAIGRYPAKTVHDLSKLIDASL